MVSKSKAVIGILGAVAVLIGAILGSGAVIDFSSTSIGQIGDNVINNYIQNELGINIDQYIQNCKAGIYAGQTAQQYCDLVT